MDRETKQIFTQRICQSNRSQLIVVMYDMIYEYIEETKEQSEWKETKQSLANVENIIRRLIEDLDFTYEISGQLYSLYRYCLQICANCRVKGKIDELDDLKIVLKPLYEAFVQLAKDDKSPQLMKNIPQITAGMTYQKGSLTEIYDDPGLNRGFLA